MRWVIDLKDPVQVDAVSCIDTIEFPLNIGCGGCIMEKNWLDHDITDFHFALDAKL